MKSVLELTPAEAKQFFLKEKSYCEFDLPPYFTFDSLLSKLSHKIDDRSISDFSSSKSRDCSNVNYVLLNNKDGKYAWRPYNLIHPAIYVSLVHKITEVANWQHITERFKQYSAIERIRCHSLPVQSESDESDRAEQVKKWWGEIEQKSIELSLEYGYLFETDIADCYCSIYSHSIAWALHDKDFAKRNRDNKKLIGNIIDWHIQDMSYGQTNGIPQGSALMDFIAEIVLGYADFILSEELTKNGINDYQIIRYRDDYRIFVNNPQTAEVIAKSLTEVLFGLGLKINSNKSKFSNEVVKNSLKPGKYFWLSNQTQNPEHQKQLFIIHSLSQNHPNSGIVHRLLDEYYHQIKNEVRSHDNATGLIAVLTDIALNSPRTYPIVAGILSLLILHLPTDESRESIVNKILKRFEKIPNIGYLQIWLQRITLKIDKSFQYSELLCNKVIDNSVEIWNSEWLDNGLRKIIDTTGIIDRQIIDQLSKSIEAKEVELFKSFQEY